MKIWGYKRVIEVTLRQVMTRIIGGGGDTKVANRDVT